MPEKSVIHATLVEIEGKGVLISGKSQSGKSDLALRLISRYNAVLVADDMVVLENKEGKIIGSAPDNLAGLLEIRGIGIIKYPYKQQTEVFMNMQLTDERTQVARMPKICKANILGLEIAQIDLYAKEDSAPDKVMAALDVFMQKKHILEDKD